MGIFFILLRFYLAASRHLHGHPKKSSIATNNLKFGWLPLPYCHTCYLTLYACLYIENRVLGLSYLCRPLIGVLGGVKNLLVSTKRNTNPPPVLPPLLDLKDPVRVQLGLALCAPLGARAALFTWLGGTPGRVSEPWRSLEDRVA